MSSSEPASVADDANANANANAPACLPIRTYHCACCSQLLLATTRHLRSLPRRAPPALDRAYLLPVAPLKKEEEEEEEEEEEKEDDDDDDDAANPESAHYTILLSTIMPDRKPVVVRRSDGFDRRRLLRCARCRVVVAYYLLHSATTTTTTTTIGPGQEGAAEDADVAPTQSAAAEEEDLAKLGADELQRELRSKRVVCVLPGSLTPTDDLTSDEKMRAVDDKEWKHWETLVPAPAGSQKQHASG
ncbi:hypothetical protein KEM52_000866 [Ascosphaera acerosa]|nr:hypothetical protein KEM52_000866 [Ascosphaera acerosa]